ncbi:MAG TPA: NADH-quinone oxidoreductase subunit L [Arachidicoccus sp.]|nr:NADH-quinone oxidoreductase subunit L [Arachidicoccus sp.]
MNLAYLVPLFPLVGFLINGLFRKQLSKQAVSVVGCGVLLASFILSLVLFFDIKAGGAGVRTYFDFINVADFKIPFAFQVDQLTAVFLLIITGVGSLIHIYSSAYMQEETPQHFARYFAYLNLFVFSMLLLVMGANFLIMFIGWEGVGLCSYLLIGYWFKNDTFNYAARKAFVMNRIGDLGFLIALFWILSKTGTLSYHELFTPDMLAKFSRADVTAITLLLFVGATGKSAQIPLYTWLPDAMAGPTPVSALIHAATMVTAGIYMIARSHLLYSLAPFTNEIIAIIGVATAVFAASIALRQNDIKKVLAYSTVSQLGYMFLGLGVGAYGGAVFHVMTHAFFKALLFLGAGSVIHAMGGQQDSRFMGGLKKFMPVTHITFLLACLAIAGVPPFSGFFSKDEILAAAYASSPVLYYLGVLGALFTAFYMFRIYAMTFLGKFRGTQEQAHHLHESPKAMTIPLSILAVLAVIAGFLGIPAIFAPHAHLLENFLSPVFSDLPAASETLSHQTEWMLMLVTTVLVIATIIWAWKKYADYQKSEQQETGLSKVLANKWYVDEIYDGLIVNPVMKFSNFLKNVIDKTFIDGIVNGVGRFVQYSSRQIRLVQSGQVGGYILMMVLSLVVLFVIFWNQAYILTFIHWIFK